MRKAILAALTAAMALSCMSVYAEEPIEIGLVSISVADDNNARCIEGVKAFAEEKGWEVTIVDANGSADEANSAIVNFVNKGVDYIIEGGQTMNPSTADILDAVEKVNADTIFVLPNNSNIILAANQAAALMKDKKLCVVPTKTIPQGITAVINFVPDLSAEDNLNNMLEEIGRVKTGQVTYAVRDTMIDDHEIKKDDFMGIGDAGILAVGQDIVKVTEEMVAAMVDDESELISVYYGSDVNEADAEALKASLEAAYDSCDIELQFGGQPIYYYVISVE